MKISFLILAHKNSIQINRLVLRLLEFDSEIFIHIDKKNYSIKNQIERNERIHILSENRSFSIEWGTLSMIDATLELITETILYSKNNNCVFDYVYLLSGQDYIINLPSNINALLEENINQNYMEVISQSDLRYCRYKKLYEMNYPIWITKNKVWIKIIKRIYMLVTGGFNYTYSCFRKKIPNDLILYFGSQWWCLNFDTIKYVCDYVEKNPQYYNFFKGSIIPDECFFQTIVMNSKYGRYIKDSLTYVNWNGGRRSPGIIQLEDYKEIDKSKYAFARKFDIDENNELFNFIDNETKEL